MSEKPKPWFFANVSYWLEKAFVIAPRQAAYASNKKEQLKYFGLIFGYAMLGLALIVPDTFITLAKGAIKLCNYFSNPSNPQSPPNH
jgi:hypothetical protein